MHARGHASDPGDPGLRGEGHFASGPATGTGADLVFRTGVFDAATSAGVDPDATNRRAHPAPTRCSWACTPRVRTRPGWPGRSLLRGRGAGRTLDVSFYRDDIGLRRSPRSRPTPTRRRVSASSTTCCSPGAARRARALLAGRPRRQPRCWSTAAIASSRCATSSARIPSRSAETCKSGSRGRRRRRRRGQ